MIAFESVFDERAGPSGWVRQAEWGSRTSRPAHKVQTLKPVGGAGGPPPFRQSFACAIPLLLRERSNGTAPAWWVGLVRTDYAAELRHVHTCAARMQVSPHRRRAPRNSPISGPGRLTRRPSVFVEV